MTIKPALHHFGIATTRHEEMIAWYRDVLGMEIVGRTTDPLPTMAFVTNDNHHHRGGSTAPAGAGRGRGRRGDGRRLELAGI